MNKVWEITLASIRSQVTAENYSTYFRPLDFKGVEQDECILMVDDAFFGDWITAHYSDLLTREVSKAFGRNLNVKIETAIKVRPKQSKKAPSSPATNTIQGLTQTNRGTDELSFPINEDYQFDRFVVGPSNELAYAAFQAASQKPAMLYNPLFLYGPTGLGKTHLLLALGRSIKEQNPTARIVYLSAEEFTNQVVTHIRNRTMDSFRDIYRNQCDVLLIDDIHVLEGKERTQEEFFHTFNALHQMKKQIVLTSDRSPEEMGGLEARLRSRFQWGLLCDIQVPELETRVAILQSKAEREGILLPHDVAFYIAEQISQNVRQLEGALVRLSAYASLRKEAITARFARSVLDASIRSRENTPTVEKIIEMVAEQYGINVDEITGKRRLKKFAHPRSLAMYLCRKYTQASFPMIGESFGGKDHSTVVAACKKVEKSTQNDSVFAQELSQLEHKIPNASK